MFRIDDAFLLRVAQISLSERNGYFGWRVPAQDAGTEFVLAGLMAGGNDCLYALLETRFFHQRQKWLRPSQAEMKGVCFAKHPATFFGIAGAAT